VQPKPYLPTYGRAQRIYAGGAFGPQEDLSVPVPPVPDVGGEEGQLEVFGKGLKFLLFATVRGGLVYRLVYWCMASMS
jgi:hypothetical protein